MEITAIIISAVALCISAINSVYFFVIRHRNLKFEIRRIGISKLRSLVNIYFCIENHSQLSISITQVKLVIGTEKYPASVFSETVLSKTLRENGEIVKREDVKSQTMPINLMPLASFAGHISFLIPEDSLSGHEKQLTFEISTNRGNPFQTTCELHEHHRLF